DFNEVRSEHERFGTIFNVSGAKAFNHFISASGLIDLPLEGQFIQDHRPIIMREVVADYGSSPFRVYHSWFTKDGFDKLVEDSWKTSSFADSSKITILRKKFQALKASIKAWCKDDKQRSSEYRLSIQSRLSDLDKMFDSGHSNEDLVNERTSLPESDENSKFFHGIINMKRSQLAIRGVLIEGDWIDKPYRVKNEFLNHFSNRFARPTGPNIVLDSNMFKQLSSEQIADLWFSQEKVRAAASNHWLILLFSIPSLILGVNGWMSSSKRNYWDEVPVIGDRLLLELALLEISVICPFKTNPNPRLYAHGEHEIYAHHNLRKKISEATLECFFRRAPRKIETRTYIDDLLLPTVGSPTRWVKVVQIKINIFAWKVCLDKLPTRLNLSLRGIDIRSIVCPNCSLADESCSHLFFSCSMARLLWRKVTRWWDFDIPEFSSYEEWITWFKSIRIPKVFKDVLEGVFYVMWWVIWNFATSCLLKFLEGRDMDLLFGDIVLLSFHLVF
ncbi:RNA-directed DNA polymerase, eukaryota, partial [Tanacetum coccineum]